MRRITLVSMLLFCGLVAAPAFAQTNLRGWYDEGQVWLVWTDDQTFSGHETYDIYVSDQPITDISLAFRLGRLFPQDWLAERLKIADPAATWTVPDGAGGTYTLADDEALFVHTPHVQRDAYFAVVKNGDTAVGPDNTLGPIPRLIEPVTCHEQLSGTTLEGNNYTVYSLWIDGRADHTNRRIDIDVMGNRQDHGTGYPFVIYEPIGGPPADPAPMMVQFHGGDGNFTQKRPGGLANIDNVVPDGYVASLDSALFIAAENAAGTPFVMPSSMWWFGHWEGYDRFQPSNGAPPDNSLVVDYVQRRVAFTISWLMNRYPIDPERLSVAGHSMGGSGASFTARLNPDRVAAGIAWEPMHSIPTSLPGVSELGGLLGTAEQNLPTTVPGAVGIADLARPGTLIDSLPDPGPMLYVWGRNDDVVLWDFGDDDHVPARMAELNASKSGAVIDWDQRDHSIPDWGSEYWTSSPRHGAAHLTSFRLSDSFPAVFNVDHLPIPGFHPDPGDGDPADGDPEGTWGGWVEWERDTMVDTADQWAATLFLVGDSDFDPDNSPTPMAEMDLAIRRASSFLPAAGSQLYWTHRSTVDDELRAHGGFAFDGNGPVTLPETLLVERGRDRSRITVTYASDVDGDDYDAQIDCDPLSATLWTQPGEVNGLVFGDDVTISWIPVGEPGGDVSEVSYDVLRADSPRAFDLAACAIFATTANVAVVPTLPAPGEVLFYLVRAVNGCPDGVGTIGYGSSGAERTGASCPN